MHCHAGYGRTGLAIACVLIFMHNIAPEQAIKIVRRDRPGSVQTAAQAKFVRTFHEYMNAPKVVFALPGIHDRFSVSEVLEQQNRMVHGAKKTSGATHHAVPRVLDFLCREVERAADTQPAAVVHALAAHVPFVQLDGKSAGDVQSLHEAHVRGIFGSGAPPMPASPSSDSAENTSANSNGTGVGARGSHFVNTASIDTSAAATATAGALASPTAPVSAPPPVPSFVSSAFPSVRAVTQDELFPIKVALNVGEANWHEASALCASASVPCVPVLLLDWLEHLAEPLLDVGVLDSVTAHDGETHAIKSKALNKLPIHVVKSLDRVVSCLRVLQQKVLVDALSASTSVHDSANSSSHGTSSSLSAAMLFDATCVRMAMALFHIRSAASASLARHADFVTMLVRDWHAPKRLELNLESLQKLGKTAAASPSARKLSHSSSNGNTNNKMGTMSSGASSLSKSTLVLEQSPTSPKTPRSMMTTIGGGDHSTGAAVVLEPMVHHHPPRPASASPSASSSPRDHVLKPKESHDGTAPPAAAATLSSSSSAHTISTASPTTASGGAIAVPPIHSPRPAPSDHLPKATRDASSNNISINNGFETTTTVSSPSSASSPVKIEPLHLHARAPSERPPSPLKTTGAAPIATDAPAGASSPSSCASHQSQHSHHHLVLPHHHTTHQHTTHQHPHHHTHHSHTYTVDTKKDATDVLLSTPSTSPTRSMSFREKESESMATVHASPTSSSGSGSGLGSSSSACVLPSVRGGDRYKHKHS